MSSCNILQYTENDRITVLKSYGRTPETLRNDIENIKEWLAKQAHLPEIAEDNLIERFLLLNKFRIEVTKKKLDMYYTVRKLVPELYDKNPSSSEMQKVMDVIHYVTLPKLTQDLYRVTITKFNDTNPDHFDPVLYTALALSVGEIRIREDCNMSDLQVFDFGGISVGHLLKFNPLFARRCGFVLQKVFSNRILGIHFINAPAFTEPFLQLLKAVVQPKVLERVHVHKDSESLLKFIPKEVLPKDYGGNEKSMEEINNDWKKKLQESKALFEHLLSIEVDERLRADKLPNDELFGTEGNFRRLDLD